MQRLGVETEIAELAIGHKRVVLERLYNLAWQLRCDAFAKVFDHVAQLLGHARRGRQGRRHLELKICRQGGAAAVAGRQRARKAAQLAAERDNAAGDDIALRWLNPSSKYLLTPPT
jgi:hypothetical protein